MPANKAADQFFAAKSKFHHCFQSMFALCCPGTLQCLSSSDSQGFAGLLSSTGHHNAEWYNQVLVDYYAMGCMQFRCLLTMVTFACCATPLWWCAVGFPRRGAAGAQQSRTD
jgi:hypothetical protein